MKLEILTIFPGFFAGPLECGIVRRAQLAGIVEVAVRDLREFAHDHHRTVDDRPFGGGEGMVMKPEPVFECAEALNISARALRAQNQESVVLLSPQGELFTQRVARDLARLERVVLICGRYEGVDERVSEHLADRELSVGDYVLSGGELAAAIVLDAVTRLLPGALGNEKSALQESFTEHAPLAAAEGLPDSTCGSGGLLDYPHYTRPAEFRGWRVPEELISGNHREIREWRRRRALEKTLRNRPDLLDRIELNREEKDFITRRR